MKITITGIDHAVTPDELEQLARCEPTIEVEFAALLGSHNGSKPRYPPWSLIEAFAAFAKTVGVSSALHLCGKWAREAVSGDYSRELTVLARKFGRIQVNGQRDLEAIAAFGVRIRRPVIAQVASFEGTLGGLEYPARRIGRTRHPGLRGLAAGTAGDPLRLRRRYRTGEHSAWQYEPPTNSTEPGSTWRHGCGGPTTCSTSTRSSR